MNNINNIELKIGKLKDKILDHIPKLKGKKLIVVGDLGLDEYVQGEVKRISPEAPVPILEVTTEDNRLGLATNVAQNIASLGGIAHLIGVVGEDSSAQKLRELLLKSGVSDKNLVVDSNRPTTRKLRVMSGHHHLVRVDFERRQYLNKTVEDIIFNKVESLISDSQGLILEDYAKGVLSESCIQRLIQLANQQNKPVLIDPNSRTPAQFYKGATLMTPNRDEAFELSGLEIDDLRLTDDSVLQVGEKILKTLELKHLIITQGKMGMSLFSDNKVSNMPTYARQVFDVTGAGDTVIAALALAWVSGLTLEESCALANFAAGVVVGKVGCVPCEALELIEYIKDL